MTDKDPEEYGCVLIAVLPQHFLTKSKENHYKTSVEI